MVALSARYLELPVDNSERSTVAASVVDGAVADARLVGVKTRNLIIAAVITGTLILGAFIIQFATDPRFLGG
jgi:hypothetical protein